VGSNCPGFTTYYQDNDGDSYGNPAATQGACQLPVGYVLNNLDCDDSNANIKPGATEICNGADDDCDTLTDENGMTGTASGNSPVCEGSTLQLNTSSNPLALSYAWSGPNGFVSGIGNPAIHNITMAATGTYTVSMTNFGCAATAEVTIIVNANPVVSASSNSPVCENMSLQLSASGAYTYAWSGPDGYTGTGAGPAIYPVGFSAAGIYTVTGTDANGCTDTNTTEVVVNAQPEASVTSSGPLSVCPGSSLQLLANTGINLSWQWQFSADNTDWDNISGAVQSTLEVTSNGYFRVVVTNTGSGCMKSSASVEVTILDLPVAVISGDTATCAGNIATFTASGGISYIWSTGDTTAALNTAAAGDYYVIVTDINGCSDSESVTLTIRALPTALIEGLAEICEGQTTLLTATGGTSYLWSDDQTSATISADMAGTYSVTVTNNVGCTDTATFILTSLPSPEVTISGNTYLCGGDPTYLTASGGISYQWSSSESTPDISTAIPGTYTVTATGDNGCTATADIIISDATATAAITGDINICPGETTTLNAFGGVTFLWNTAANSSSLSGIGAGTYSVTVTNSQGCSDDASVTVELLDAPVAAIAGDNIICLGAQATLTATATGTPGPYSYSWSTGMTNDFSVTVAPLITTIYQVTVTAANGCTGNTLFEVEVSGHIPVMDFAGGTEFEGHIVSPVAASGYDNYTFKIKYTDADGDLPEGGFPRMFLKYNPPGNSGFDLNIPMSEADPLDQDVTDGKIYQLTLNGMNIGQNWAATFTATDAAGCTASWNPGLSEPDVLDYLDVFVYANDIVFSQAHPDTNEAIVVLTTIHNPSDFPAVDFVVRLHNDFSNEDYGTQTITLAAHATTILSWNIITPEVGSWNPIRVFIDDTGVLAETNEYNNNAVRPFICGDFELPGGISVTAAANNILYDPGANPLNLVILTGHASYFGLPPGLMLNNVGVAGADLTFSIEELGQNFYTTTDNNGNFSLVIATSMTNPGTYHINDGNVTDFSLNGDFTASFSIITGTPPSPCLLPDLSTSTSVPGGNIFPGDSRTISITVSNTGTASAPPHELRITPGSNMTPGAIEYAAIPLIPAGGSYTFDRTYTFNNTGAQTLVLAADVNNFVNECYETNNGFYNSFAVLPYLPDARVSGFSMPQPGLFCRDNEFSVTIQNAGYDLSGASVTHLNITRIADGSTLLQQDIITPALAPNATFSFSIADPFPEPASYRIDIVADYNNEVTEFNENNLFVAFANLVECQQDLDIYSYRQATKNAVYDQTGTGTTLTFPVIIGNPGQTDISDEFVLRAEILNGVTVVVQEDITINTDIPSGSTHTQTVNITNPTPGPLYTLQLTVDPGNILPESNEGNNYFGGIGLHHDYEPALMCEEREDISGEEMDFVGSVIIRDLNTPVWCWVHKRGDLKDLQLKVKFEARLKSGNTWLNLGTATIGPVTGQGTAACPNLKVFTPQPFAFPTAGLWELRVTADPLNTIIESNESNNVFLHDFSVIEQPDLATYSYYINPSHLNPNPGQAITIDMTYKNLGQIIPSGQPFQLRCLVDNNVIGTTGHPFQDFPTGATNTVQFDFTVPIDWGMSGAELHIIRVIADADTQINEVNELNNEATRAFIVGLAPDYIVESLQYSSGTILVTVKNNGSGPGANGILQLLYKDQNGTLIPIDDAQNLVLSGLSANASQQVSFAWTLPPEAIYLVARINSVNPAEFNVLNNEAETDLSVPPLVLTGTTTASCNNGANGTASIDVNGGESPFTYSWSVLSAGSNSIDGLAPGDYSVTVTDDNGSTASLELTVGGLDPPVAIITGDTNICSGESTELTASGGVSYIWSYFDLTSDIVSVSPASSDTFFVTITDVNGCSDEANVVVLVEIPTAFYPDSDGDSYGAGMPVMACIVPENHVTDNSDCNDADIDINPGATELCNSVDDDCDGILNEGYPTTTYYRDFDGDGKGNPAVSIESCYQPDGYVANATDCDDNSATACPKPSGMSSSAVTDVSATVSWGYLPCATKYRLEYRRKTPPATGWTVVYTTSPTYDITGLTGPNIQYQWRVATICSPNGIGAESGYATMQSFYTKYKVYTDADMDGFGDVNAAASYVSTMPQPGYSANQTDCDDASATTYPGAPELCNGIDDDCDLIVDEGANWYQDADGDGLGNAAVSLNACLQPSGYVANSVDCNDNSTTPVCATPANVTATGIGASFVTINWTTSPCASGYTVMYRIAPSGAFSTQFNTTGSSMMLSGLLPVTTYQARVRAKCPAPNTVTTSNWVYVTFTTNGTGLIEQVDEDISTLDPLTFGVYPNPGDGRFTLSIPGDTDGEADISVLDGFGKLIHSVRWSVYEGITVNELDLTHLPGGVYHINIRKGDMMQTKKVVIVR
jgi:subtilase family serine protease